MQYKWGHVIPPTAEECGRADGFSLGLLWLERRLLELAGILAKGSRAVVPLAARQQWVIITAVLSRPAGPLAALVESTKDPWQWIALAAGSLALGDTFAVPALRQWAALARAALKARADDTSRASSAGWRKWVQEQLREGAGALHRFVERGVIAPDQAVGCPSDHGPSLSLQNVVDSDKESWSRTWNVFQDSATAPWRDYVDPDANGVERLPPLTATILAEASTTFRRRTSLG